MLSRRAFLGTAVAGTAGVRCGAKPSGAKTGALQIGVMDTVFRMAGKPEALRVAKRLGLDGMQVTLGRSTDGRTLPLEDPALQSAWLAASKEHGVPLNSTYLDMLHTDCLKDHPSAPLWVRKGIQITKNLQARVLMLVFFGKCQVRERADLDRVIALFHELAPEAERAGVVLGFENTNSGDDNRYAVDRVASQAFRIWYDVGNATTYGYDPPAEIRALGRDRICMFHFKDRAYLGEGPVHLPEVLRAIRDIRFQGFANLETASPSGDPEADTKRNLAYVRRLMRGESEA